MGSESGPYRNTPPSVLPASHYLHERLQERRARNTRPKRSRHTDFGPRGAPDDDIFLEEAQNSRDAAGRLYDTSPLVAASRTASHAGSDAGASGYSKRRSLGVKDMDGQIDRLNKQNFALKLELDHRREQQSKLREQMDAMREQAAQAEQVREEHAELLRINSQLVEELEKRDRAVEEAMDIICDLEDKLADMDERRSYTRPSTANADSGYAGTETHEAAPPSSPPEVRVPKTPHNARLAPPPSAASQKLARIINGQTPAPMRREPSVFSLKKSSTHALRSVYMENAQNLHPVQSFNSLISKRDSRVEEDGYMEEAMNSPRLSVLSESSFPSLYSPQKQASPEDLGEWDDADDHDAAPDSGPAHFRQASINRVSKWISEGDMAAAEQGTPSKSTRLSSPLAQSPPRKRLGPTLQRTTGVANFQSLDDAMSTASTTAAHQPEDRMQSNGPSRLYRTKGEKQRAMRLQLQGSRPNSVAGPVFGEALLPPTPDSASTRMLRSSSSSMTGDRTLLDSTPAPVKAFDALAPRRSAAPKQVQSSIELHRAYHAGRRDDEAALGNRQDDSSSEGSHDDGAGDDDDNDDDDDARSETLRDYDGFPDGNSLHHGTPSRFMRHANKAPTFFDPHDLSPPPPPPEALLPSSLRPKPSSQATISTRRPSLGPADADSTPTFSSPLTGLLGSDSRPSWPPDATTTTTTATSPHSQSSFSASSGTRTAVPPPTATTTTSPDFQSSFSASSGPRTVVPPPDPQQLPARTRSRSRTHSRPSTTPTMTLGQRTQMLIRRMSNNQPPVERAEPRSSMLSRGSGGGGGGGGGPHHDSSPVSGGLPTATAGVTGATPVDAAAREGRQALVAGGEAAAVATTQTPTQPQMQMQPQTQTQTQTQTPSGCRQGPSRNPSSTTGTGSGSGSGSRRLSLQLQFRANTSPPTTTASGTGTGTGMPEASSSEQRMNPFRRSYGGKKTTGTGTTGTTGTAGTAGTTGTTTTMGQGMESDTAQAAAMGARRPPSRRRGGSVREVIGGRRPWR